MIGIIDYGRANLGNVKKAFAQFHYDSKILKEPSSMDSLKGLVLPGVGAFEDSMESLNRLGFCSAIRRYIQSGRPFLGICVGLQLLFESSEELFPESLATEDTENGSYNPVSEGLSENSPKNILTSKKSQENKKKIQGLGILRGKVVRFSDSERVPHIGWNQVCLKKESPLFLGTKDGEFFYFVHSYYPVPEDSSISISNTSYGINFCSAIQKENIFATQFHPEKSQSAGIQIIRNFARVCDSFS